MKTQLNDKLITGITIKQQIKKAKEILKNEIIPKENKFQQKKMTKDIKKILAAWGDSQKQMVIEELAELITAILHFERGKINKKDLISEVADVEIMLKQLKIIYNLPQSEIDVEMRFKLNRTINKIEQKENIEKLK